MDFGNKRGVQVDLYAESSESSSNIIDSAGIDPKKFA